VLLRAPDVKVRMDDVHPAGWKIIFSSDLGDEWLQAAKGHHLPALLSLRLGSPELIETEGVLAKWFAAQDVQAAIVRPDHYIYGVARTPQEVSIQLQALKLA
jgi:3-(3-hydroxy-phenyl)propionate hydroxylase